MTDVNGCRAFPAHALRALAITVLVTSVTLPAYGQVAVSDGGTPAYSTPISVPPGLAGMSPQIGLAYSAGGVNGPVGLGWSVQGISAITRCAGIRASDAAVKAVTFTPSDKLCLDGQRLIQTNAAGTPVAASPAANGALADANGLAEDGSSFTEYRTEKDSFSRIRAYGSAGGVASNGPRYFKVWTKSGQIYEYGSGPNSGAGTNANAMIVGLSSAAPIAWAVARISDTLGNYIDFKYVQRSVAWGSGPVGGATPGREWNLGEIQYTGNSVVGQAPSNKVIFEYEDRATTALTAQDRSEAYHGGQKNVSVQRLKAIRTYINWPGPGLGINADGTLAAPPAAALKVKTFKLAYDIGPVSARSRLTSIAECAGSAETACTPPTKFSYGSTASPGEAYTASTVFANNFQTSRMTMTDPAGAYGVMVGDFFGDGRHSFIRWANDKTQNQLWRSDGTGNFTQIGVGTGPGQFNITDQNLFSTDGCFYSLLADINGDGLPDIVRYNSPTSPSGAACSNESTYVYLNKGDGSFTRVLLTGPSLARATSKAIAKPALPEEAHAGWSSGANFFFVDVDGDGKMDIVTTILPFYSTVADVADPCLSQVCTKVWRGNGDGTFTQIATNLANKSLYVKPTLSSGIGGPRNVVDFDGDGLADLVDIDTKYFSRVSGYRSTGDGNFVALGGYASGCNFPLDFNGDGRADCLVPSSDGSAAGSSLVAAVGGGSYGYVAGFNLHAAGQELSSASGSPVSVGIAILDVNGDGRSDLLRWKDDPAQNALYLSNGDGTFRSSATFNLAGIQLRKSDGNFDFVVGDFTGHGNPEILRMAASPTPNTPNVLYVKSDSVPPDQLLTVTSPSGLVSRLTYVPITNSASGTIGNRYATARVVGGGSTLPKVDITPPIYVVATLDSDTGVGASRVQTEYAYRGLRANVDGRGLLGFMQVSQQRPGPNGQPLTVVTSYVQDHPYIGVASVTETFLGTIGQTTTRISRTTNAYCDASPPAPTASAIDTSGAVPVAPVPCPSASLVQRPYISQSFEEGWDVDAAHTALPTVKTTNTFNTAGDPLTISSVTSGTAVGGIFQQSTKTTTNSYVTDLTSGDNWVLGRLQSSSVQSTVYDSLASIATSAGTAPNASSRTVPAATLTASPTTLVALAPAPTAASGSVTFSNSGATPFTLALSISGGNTLSTTTLTCPASASCGSVTVTSGTALGTYSGELTATPSNGGTPMSVPISLRVVTPANISATPSSVTATSTAPTAASATVQFTNAGQMPTTLTLAVSGGSTLSTSTLTCPAAGSCGSVTLTTPATAGTYNGTLTMTSSAGGTVTSVPVTMKVLTQAIISASPAAVSSTTTTPTAASGVVTYTNSGQTAATLTLSVTGGASLSVTTLSCPVQASCGSVTITSPTAAGSYSGTLSATASSGGTVASVPLTLLVRTAPSIAATSTPSPLTVTTTTPTAAGGSVSFTNNGQTPTTLTLSITGGASLSTTTLSCPANAACGSVTVTSPTAAGNYSGTLGVTSSAGGTVPSIPVALNVLTAPNVSATSSPSPLSVTTTAPTAASGTVTLTNNGQTATTLSLSATGGATPSPASLSCPANGSCGTVTITSPTSAGTYSGALNVASSAGGTVPSVPLTLVVRTPPSISGTSSPSPLTVTTMTPTVASGTATFSNAGQTPTTLTLAIGANLSLSTSTLACPANGSCGTVTVSSPTAAGSYSSTLTMSSSAGGTVASVPVNFTVLTAPNVSPSVSTLTSNTTSPTAASGSVSFTNTGQTATTLSLSVTGGSSLSTTTLSCPANGGCGSVTLTSPTAGGNYSGTLSATSSAGGTVGSVAVNFVVANPVPANITVSPTALTFGQVLDTGATSSQTLTVSNSGGAAILTAAFSGTNASDFTITGGNCVIGGVIAAGGNCTVTVTLNGRHLCGPAVGSVPESATITLTASGINKSATLNGSNYVGKTGFGTCG